MPHRLALSLAATVIFLAPSAASAAVRGPGPIRTLGTAPGHAGAATIVGDGRRFAGFGAPGGRRVRIWDARRRRLFSLSTRCTLPWAGSPGGLLLFVCPDYDKHAVVVDAVHRRVHTLRASGDDPLWIAVGRRYAQYSVETACDQSGCTDDTYLVDWRTGKARKVPTLECDRNLDERHPRQPCRRTPRPGRWRVTDGSHDQRFGFREAWLIDRRTSRLLRLSRTLAADSFPQLVDGWATWVEHDDRAGTIVRARSVPGGRRRRWIVGGQWPAEQVRVGSDVVIAVRAEPGRRRVLALPLAS